MDEYILIAVVGRTDPIRGEHDGPILHIIRNYKPKQVVLILTKEIEADEMEYHYMKDVIHLLDKECEVCPIRTGIVNVHSYDDFSEPFLQICNTVKENNPDKKILLNITSGTPQMETALCMIALSDTERYLPVQVESPERRSNKAQMFNPQKDLVEEWFEMDIDNEVDSENRCKNPKLWNFKRPMLQFQILSLIKNYDYAGALQIAIDNKECFPEKTRLLLEHAKERLNLKNKDAEMLAGKLRMKQQLYPIARSDINQLVEFFNSMKVKQERGELSDFAMRLEVMNVYLGMYILKNCMRLSIDDITVKRKTTWFLSKEKACNKIPGIDLYMNQRFGDRDYEWGRALNGRSLAYIISYISQKEAYQKYQECANRMIQWAELSGQVRNPAAHTIIAITDETFKENYDNRDSAILCKDIKTIFIKVFEGQMPREGFDIYQKINEWIKQSMEE